MGSGQAVMVRELFAPPRAGCSGPGAPPQPSVREGPRQSKAHGSVDGMVVAGGAARSIESAAGPVVASWRCAGRLPGKGCILTSA